MPRVTQKLLSQAELSGWGRISQVALDQKGGSATDPQWTLRHVSPFVWGSVFFAYRAGSALAWPRDREAGTLQVCGEHYLLLTSVFYFASGKGWVVGV